MHEQRLLVVFTTSPASISFLKSFAKV